MGDQPFERADALRSLHEDWGVPLEVIHVASGESLEALTVRAIAENWQTADAACGLQQKVAQVFRADLERFSTSQDETPDVEKRARALSVMAKTLESIVNTQERLTEAAERQDGNGGRDGTGEIPDPERSAELDRELARLVEGLA